MKWKKFFKIGCLVFLIIAVVFSYGFYRLGEQIYGGLTEEAEIDQYNPATGSFLIQNVSILSPDGERMIAHQDVKLDQGKIIRIDSTGSDPGGATVINGKGKFLIPGLIDAHVHLWKSPNDLLVYIANGVTQVRELVGEPAHLKWREEIKNGRIGPELYVASPRLGSFETMEGIMMEQTQYFINVQDADQARKTVQELHEQGYDAIKIYSHLNKESYLAVTKTAAELNMPYVGHIPWAIEFSDVWANGQQDIVHLEELMNALQRDFEPEPGEDFGSFYGKEEAFLEHVSNTSDAIADQLIANDIAVTTTLWLVQSFVRQKFELEQVLNEVELEYQNPGLSEWVSYIPGGLGWLPEVNRYKMPADLSPEKKAMNKTFWETYGEACKMLANKLAAKGVSLLAGTDANVPPAVPGFSLHDELRALADAGLSPQQVLRSATVAPSGLFKRNTGKIATGYEADLVLLAKNPLENIEHTTSIEAVISKGRVFDRALLDQLLESVRAANNASREVSIEAYTGNE